MATQIDPASVERLVLPNGLTALLRADHSAPVVAIVTHVRAGYFDETDDIVGIAHVLEHMFFKGTKRRGVGEIAKATKASGGYLNAHTIYDNTTYFTVLPSSGFEAGLDIQADAYANSLIDAGELAKELEVIIQEAKRKADNPSALSVETLYALLHDSHRLRRWRIGHEAGLRTLTRDALVRFYRNFYRPSNTILTVVGDVDGASAIDRISELYGSLPDSTPERSPGPIEGEHDDFRYRELSGDIAQSQLLFGWRTPRALHDDTPVLEVAASILGTGRASRLYRALRERQLASSVSAYNYVPTELGVFTVHAETSPERTEEAAVAIAEQVHALREDPIPDEEIERARRIFDARWIRRLETMEGQANHLAEWEAIGGWETADDYKARFMSADASDVKRVAIRYLAEGRTGIVAYRPEKSPPIASSTEEMRQLLDGRRPAPLEILPPRLPTPLAVAGTSPTFLRKEAGVSVYRAASGLPILVHRKGSAIAHLGLFAYGGARDEPAELSGITTLVARSMLKGTRRRSAAQLAEDVELLGGSISAGVSLEGFGWTISVPTEHLAVAAEIIGDVVQGAALGGDAIETERTVALADVIAMRDDMFRYPVRLALGAAFKGHPYAISSLGTERTLRSVSIREVRDWYRARVLKGTLVAGIVGDVDPATAAAIVANELESLSPSTPLPLRAPEWPSEVTVRAETRDKAQTALAIAFPGPTRSDPDRFAAHIVAGVASGLGGRFFDELRDRQSLAYTVHAYSSEHQLAGAFVSYIATSPEKEEVARAGLLAEFQRLRDEPVTAEELDRAKQYAIGSHAIRLESGGAILGDMIDAWMLGSGLSEIDEHDSRIEAVTSEDVQRLARRYFDPSRRAEGVVRGLGRTV